MSREVCEKVQFFFCVKTTIAPLAVTTPETVGAEYVTVIKEKE